MKSTFVFSLCTVLLTILFTGTSSRAADTNNVIETSTATPTIGVENMSNNEGLYYDQTNYYRANELSVDVFGTASVGQYTIENPSNARIRNNTQFGVGAGLNYYITKYVGIGADAYSENTTGAFIDSVSANLLVRLPLGNSGFAPYIYGGGGHQFDMVKAWFGQAGAGMEYRFCPRLGLFIDARWVLPNETKYYGVARFGVRFVF